MSKFTEQTQDARDRILTTLATLKVMQAAYWLIDADDLDAQILTLTADKLEAVEDAWTQAQQLARDERERAYNEGAAHAQSREPGDGRDPLFGNPYAKETAERSEWFSGYWDQPQPDQMLADAADERDGADLLDTYRSAFGPAVQ